jgi:lysophospholipase L1-like esterase
MFRFIVAYLFVLGLTVSADPSFVIWPMTPPAAGLSAAEYPAFQEYGYYKSFQDNIDKARAGRIDLLFDGDENTCYWQGPGGNIWKRFESPNTIDFAPEHDRVENLLWRLNHGELDGLHPKLVVLQIGTNDIGWPNHAPEIASGIKAAVDTVRTRCPDAHVLLMGLFPRGATATADINALISKFADGKSVTFLDLSDKLLQPDGKLSPELIRDSGLLTEKGYQVWADALAPIVDQYCPKAAAAAPAAPAPVITSDEPQLSWPCPLAPGPGSTTFPAPPIYWIQRFVQNLDKLKQGPYELLFDGDSITDRWQDPGKEVWNARYGKLKAIDMGIAGDEVQNVLWRVQHGEVDGQNLKLIVLLIGTNNHGQDPKGVAAGIKLLINEYETRCPSAHILLLGIFPVGPTGQTDHDWRAQVNNIIATYDDGKRVTYMDIGAKFLQPDGTISAETMSDFLHPTAKGYAIWADAIQPVIDKYFPKGAGQP